MGVPCPAIFRPCRFIPTQIECQAEKERVGQGIQDHDGAGRNEVCEGEFEGILCDAGDLLSARQTIGEQPDGTHASCTLPWPFERSDFGHSILFGKFIR